MTKIKLNDLIKILNRDVINPESCIEISFFIDDDKEYNHCWMGKMPDRNNPGKELYWFGLVPDGSQAFSYDKSEDILNAKVFHGKSLTDIIEKITWQELNSCSMEEMLKYY